MRVVVPYTDLHPRVVPAIEAQGYHAETWRMVNEVHYPHLLRELFASGEDFCLIEHDVESRPGFLESLEECPAPWCFNAYDFTIPYDEAVCNDGPISVLADHFSPLGHTRFRGGVGKVIAQTLDSPDFLSSWISRDTRVSAALVAAGYRAHRHKGKALHRHDYG